MYVQAGRIGEEEIQVVGENRTDRRREIKVAGSNRTNRRREKKVVV